MFHRIIILHRTAEILFLSTTISHTCTIVEVGVRKEIVVNGDAQLIGPHKPSSLNDFLYFFILMLFLTYLFPFTTQ